MRHVATMAPLLERERELDDLDRVLDDALAGRGRVLLVEGPAGIGKTRLLDAARERGQELDMAVLSARASELDREFPLGVVRQLLEPLLVGTDPARRASLLQGAAAGAAAALGPGPPPGNEYPALAALERFHALYWLIANLSEEAPAVLAIDDAHWADPDSLLFLEFLAPRLSELPVLVALATRPSEPGAERRSLDVLATDALALVLRPAPLTDGAVGELVAAELGDWPDGEFRDACLHATGGNPFLLRELLRELAAERVAPVAEQAGLVRQLAPPTVARAVLLRLARLGDEATALARAVAVIGDGAPLERASALAELELDRADELAAVLARAGILAPARPLAFAHPVLRSAVYSDIDAGERTRAHRCAAALLAEAGATADEIAVQLLPTEPAGDAAVVATLREAAAHAGDRGAPATALACLRRALAEPPAAADGARVLFELAAVELHAGDPAAAAKHFREGELATADPRERAAHAWEHTLALQAIGRAEETYALRERAAAEVADVDPELALLVEATLIASAGLDLSRREWARGRLDRHRGRLAADTPARAQLLALCAFHDAMYGTQPAGRLADDAERALTSGLLVDPATGFPTTSFFAAVEVLWLADRAVTARRALDVMIDHARRRGAERPFAVVSGWRCMLHAREGALLEAEADARSCAELAVDCGGFALAPPMLGYVLSVLLDRGEPDAAYDLLERTGMAGREVGQDASYFPALHVRARLRAARGDVAGGRADFATLGTRCARWNTDLALVPAVLVAPQLAGDDPDEARAYAERMLDEARRWDTPRAIGMALRAAGLVESGPRGIDLLEEAVATLEGSPARLEHARALTDLGAALRRANRRAAAREPLRAALDAADACGARPLAERARHELRAAGGRPRRPRFSGVEALTASERRIATMAADGLSNPEIAQALFVTKKTVEAHLGNAYRKLGIHSRAELPRALRAPS